ncbi:complex I subunit 4 family protein [Salinarchaeum laminariae]|uniref:complex I subunit 4 family protein n=1 Tax=Salinarchaeum laminariae TaxID=869888 RepID=UPI0020BE3213|nr:NuoM family protein [Salinarchaeum laminariae]
MIIEALLAVTLLGGIAVLLAPDRLAGKLAFGISLGPLLGGLWMFWQFDGSGNLMFDSAAKSFESSLSGTTLLSMGPWDVQWLAAVDGISLPLVVLSTILTTLAIVSAWTPIDERQSQFYALVLFMEAALIGVFTALDFFVWFVFWEGVLVPMVLLIGVWGGPRRKYAAIKFLVYTNVASAVLFVGFLGLLAGLDGTITSFALPEISQAIHAGELQGVGPFSPEELATVSFFAMFAGFAVKVPIVPVHTWLPDAHVEAPTPVSVLLAGVLLKMGTYALLRFNFTMLPEVAMANAELIAAIAVISILYGAMLALAQRDLKRIVAYSSVSSMGYVILGLVAFTVYGVGGATFQMLSHGLISGLLFMTVGVIYNTTHTRMVGDMSGLADRMPVASWVFVAGAFGYMGLPLMSGFAAELFVFIGAFGAEGLQYSPIFTALGMFGIVIVAGYLLSAMQKSLFGPFRLETDYEIGRAPFHDVAPLFVLLGLIVLLGVAPDVVFDMVESATQPIVDAAAENGGGA